MAKKNEADEMLLFNPGYLFRFREKVSSKLSMGKKHFVMVLIGVTILTIALRVLSLKGIITFS